MDTGKRLAEKMAQLRAEMRDLKFSLCRRQRSPAPCTRKRSCTRTSSPGWRNSAEECWYHQTFGGQARKCHPPCRRKYDPGKRIDRQAATTIPVDKTLSDNTTSIKITGVPSSYNTTRISVATQHDPRYVEILRRYKHLTQPIKQTDVGDHQTQHNIKTTGQPAYSRPRRLPPYKLAYAKKAFGEMLADNIIRPSDRPYASPLHLVPKSDGDFRICVDYRKLNASAVPDRYPVPHIHDFASDLQGGRIFSKIDLTKAYYQVPVAPEDIPKTAVTTPFGLFEFLKCPSDCATQPRRSRVMF
ncbi:unnamed protein product [Acanthosepion pharaonis]|uniref:Reverse transcriptase domain-containing protein n=1 Tax=Acanthosepion pharaonis TaxID=158019 RepID=A0A812ES46_ACAPH|nr:unnamed protein product [Sepia pharaonis]